LSDAYNHSWPSNGRNGTWRTYPRGRLIEFGLVRLIPFLALLPREFNDGATKERGFRENCTSLFTERMEEGLRLDLLPLYSERERATDKGKRPAGVQSFERNIQYNGRLQASLQRERENRVMQTVLERTAKLDGRQGLRHVIR
jgi:hypothetical protein